MAKEKFLLLSLKEDKAKKLAQVISNETSRKILDHLAEKEATEFELAKALNIPIPTVHYNLQALMEGSLVIAEKFHYSEKGKEVLHYKLANKYIIIAPKTVHGIKTKLKTICISGSVGTGKTTLAKKLSEKLGYPILDVNKFIKQKKLSEGYDKKKKCYIVDTKKLNKEIIKETNKVKKKQPKGIIIDSHLSHHLHPKYVDLCIITKCSLKTLQKRLKKKKYSKQKIRENLDCEIFDICYNEALENKHKVKVIYTNKRLSKNVKL